ncbi:MAG: SAP domain-containing protein [Pyrinomonadaceae bacterium]|nr:SAP domain-containing protein [Pyrinomonadaceae bacterium]
MPKKPKLSKSMTEDQFRNGYWYAVEIKAFANEIGIPSASKLRKDELEKLIEHFLRTGEVRSPPRQILSTSGVRDIDMGLDLKLPVVRYTSNRETKDFIVKEALKIAPNLKRKSGARYRLNRWREEQRETGNRITYGDLVEQYIKLNQMEGSFPQVPSGRYINFLSDFLAAEKNSTRKQAVHVWAQLKKLDIPKNYRAWKKYSSGNRKSRLKL